MGREKAESRRLGQAMSVVFKEIFALVASSSVIKELIFK